MSGEYPLLDELDSSLSAIVASEPVTLTGAWQPPTRWTYREPRPDGSQAGPLVEVVRVEWTGELRSEAPIVAVGFCLKRGELSWGKSMPAYVSQPVQVFLSASADRAFGQAFLVAIVGGTLLHAGYIPCAGDLHEACTLADAKQSTGHLFCLAGTPEMSYLAIILPGNIVQTGRNHLWHVRKTLAPYLSPRVRELLTRRRGGYIPAAPPGN
jgi:hypothetical protein